MFMIELVIVSLTMTWKTVVTSKKFVWTSALVLGLPRESRSKALKVTIEDNGEVRA